MGAELFCAYPLPQKTYAQSEPPISILPARVARESGYRANAVTQKNALVVGPTCAINR
jgi:hypothetical protein